MLRVKFTKENYLRYISHLDLMRLFNRAFRRANIPIKYSEGFNPQPRFSIANPLSLGIESVAEYMDIELGQTMAVETFIDSMNRVLPQDIRILEGEYIDGGQSLSSLVDWSSYRIKFLADGLEDAGLANLIKEWLKKDDITIIRIRRRRGRQVERKTNIRPFIGNISVNGQVARDKGQLIELTCLLKSGDRGNLNAQDFVNAMDGELGLAIDPDTLDIRRTGILLEEDGIIQEPIS